MKIPTEIILETELVSQYSSPLYLCSGFQFVKFVTHSQLHMEDDLPREAPISLILCYDASVIPLASSYHVGILSAPILTASQN